MPARAHLRPRRRRRLRKEVRTAGYTVLALVPLVLTYWSWSAVPPMREAGARILSIPVRSVDRQGLPVEGQAGIGSAAASSCPVPPVLLSVEPVGVLGDPDGESPVVFPGYLLPDDNREEPAHEGS